MKSELIIDLWIEPDLSPLVERVKKFGGHQEVRSSIRKDGDGFVLTVERLGRTAFFPQGSSFASSVDRDASWDTLLSVRLSSDFAVRGEIYGRIAHCGLRSWELTELLRG